MTRRINRLSALVAALVATVASAPTNAATIDEVVFFGDSLSDTGNVWFVTGGLPPPPYFQGNSGGPPDFTGGQWSGPGGPSWPTIFADRFGRTATPSLVSGGNNFAWGGARTGINTNPSGVPWLDQQVGLYVLPYQLSGTSPGTGTLVSIMIGGNDVAGNLGDSVALEAGIASIINQINILYGIGVRQFLVANVPDIGATPRFQALEAAQPGIAAFATSWTMQWNGALETAIGELELPGAVINFFDFFSFSKDPELLAMFDNTADACLTDSSLCSDPASYFYWDSFHPSSTSHALLAEGLYQTLVPTRLQNLLSDVTGVGPGKSLAKKVVRATTHYATFELDTACNVLGSFTNQVRAQAGKKLTASQAADFTSDANAIMDAIGCN